MSVIKTITKDRVLQITTILMVISLFFARPHLADISFSTLWSILGMMTVIQIFQYLHILDFCAYRLTSRANDTRQLNWMFLVLAVVAGMFLTNDVTVLTLIPLYLSIATKYDLPEVLPVTLIGMAANFGSAFTPFGNTHNIFMMNHYAVPTSTFFSWSIPLLIASLALLFLLSLLVKKVPVPTVPVLDIHIMPRPTIITCLVAGLIFAGVLNMIPAWVGAVAAMMLAFGLEPKIVGNVDYAIVLTFTGFFIIISAIRQIPQVSNLISSFMGSEHSVYLTSLVSSQLISNVPTTVLIGKFTTYAAALFLGSNIGGLGTMVGSMCNLLVYKEYTNWSSKSGKHFIPGFFGFNVAGLAVLGVVGLLILDFVY